ncbi:MAG: sugar phosphate nucleotidyltransferase [Gemmatimonadaceae bacterium]
MEEWEREWAAITKGAAKELVEVAGVPLLLRVLEEYAASGIEEALVVVSPEKNDVIRAARSAAGQYSMPERIQTVIQQQPRGLADAIRLGREFAGSDPIAVALPDNLFLSRVPALRQVIETYDATGKNVVALVELFPADSARSGPTSIYPGELFGDEYSIAAIPLKGSRSATFDLGGRPSGFTGVGRYVFQPEVFDAIDAVEENLAPGSELDDVPVLARLLKAGRLTGRRIVGEFLDVGLPSGYAQANERIPSRGRATPR